MILEISGDYPYHNPNIYLKEYDIKILSVANSVSLNEYVKTDKITKKEAPVKKILLNR